MPKRTPPRRPKRPRGSVFWHAASERWCAQSPPDRQGRRRSRYFVAEDAAWDWLNQQVEALAAGVDLSTGSERLRDYLRRWLERECASKDRDWSPSTVKLYTWAIEKVATHKLARTAVADLNRDHTDTILADLAEDSNEASGLSRKSIGMVRSVFRSALADLEDARTIQWNPVRKARPNRYESGDAEARCPWTESEIRAFLAAARKHSSRAALWWLVVSCGLRSGVVRGLKLSDLDLANGTLTFWRQKSRKWQTLDLPANVIAALREHLAKRQAIGGRLFPADRADEMSGNVLLRELQALRRAAGVPPIGRVHDLRHIAGSLMLANGYPVPVVAKILGHKTPDVTMKVYAHAIPEHVVQAPRNIADVLPYDAAASQDPNHRKATGTRPAVHSAVLTPPPDTGQGLAIQLTVR